MKLYAALALLTATSVYSADKHGRVAHIRSRTNSVVDISSREGKSSSPYRPLKREASIIDSRSFEAAEFSFLAWLSSPRSLQEIGEYRKDMFTYTKQWFNTDEMLKSLQEQGKLWMDPERLTFQAK